MVEGGGQSRVAPEGGSGRTQSGERRSASVVAATFWHHMQASLCNQAIHYIFKIDCTLRPHNKTTPEASLVGSKRRQNAVFDLTALLRVTQASSRRQTGLKRSRFDC